MRDYLPEAAAFDDTRTPPTDRLAGLLGGVREEPVQVLHDCMDGFGEGWRHLPAEGWGRKTRSPRPERPGNLQRMIDIRRATPDDAEEIVRLRRLMFAAMSGRDEPGPWEKEAVRVARRQLAQQDSPLPAFVVDGDGPGLPTHLAACAVGRIEERLPAPVSPHGLFGFIFNVCTDERYRGRGYARATTAALLEEFARRGVTRVDLHATPEAEAMYRSMGFAEHSIPLSLDASTLDAAARPPRD
ncbi:GNAT family N-acetyltransferase [Streptomyces sp. 8N114]|uniref:GNAT family N-acetyltransferase n=1 Tax=Streptomyces sp. 8N114 TaxID=3457419 RepID=UPI003FCF4396